jgi:hypothetical protein
MRTYIRVIFVAMSPYGKPIATAHNEKDLKAGLDEYYGIGTDSKAKYIEWVDNNSKYPDELEGHHIYEVDDHNGGTEIEEVKVYCVEFYPYTKYEVKDDQALIELMDHDKEAGLYDVDFKDEK